MILSTDHYQINCVSKDCCFECSAAYDSHRSWDRSIVYTNIIVQGAAQLVIHRSSVGCSFRRVDVRTHSHKRNSINSLKAAHWNEARLYCLHFLAAGEYWPTPNYKAGKQQTADSRQLVGCTLSTAVMSPTTKGRLLCMLLLCFSFGCSMCNVTHSKKDNLVQVCMLLLSSSPSHCSRYKRI